LISATGAERLSLGHQPVTKTGAALFLSLDLSTRRHAGHARAACRHLGEPRDQRELVVRTAAEDFDVDPMAAAADMRVAQAMIRTV
jgi:hypothetical protein